MKNNVPATEQLKPSPAAVAEVREAALALIQLARARGCRVEITSEPAPHAPLAMGTVQPVVAIWPARREIRLHYTRVDRWIPEPPYTNPPFTNN